MKLNQFNILTLRLKKYEIYVQKKTLIKLLKKCKSHKFNPFPFFENAF